MDTGMGGTATISGRDDRGNGGGVEGNTGSGLNLVSYFRTGRSTGLVSLNWNWIGGRPGWENVGRAKLEGRGDDDAEANLVGGL